MTRARAINLSRQEGADPVPAEPRDRIIITQDLLRSLITITRLMQAKARLRKAI